MSHLSGLPPHLAERLPVAGFINTRILVIGDTMLDRYVIGEATRLSPEAPVPVVVVQKEKITAGGAGNVAMNLVGLRVQTLLAGIIGSDVMGSILADVLHKAKIDVEGLVEDTERPTTCKTRVMCGNHQLVRFDNEVTFELQQHVANKLRERIMCTLDTGVDAVILSDYAKGVFTFSFTQSVIKECQKRNIPIFVDPKQSDYSLYAGATCLTPNLKEFHLAVQKMNIPNYELSSASQILRERLRSPMLLVTQGSHGMTIVQPDLVRHFPALAEEVFDVSGAGDTVIATLAAAYVSGLDPFAAVELSNIAASVVVRKVGTVPILWQELQMSSPNILADTLASQTYVHS